MFVKIYVYGAPLYQEDRISKKDRFVGRSTAAVRDTCVDGKSIPVFLRGAEVGRATRMEKIEASSTPYLCFDTELNLEAIPADFCRIFYGLLAEIKGVMWTSGLYPRELHLRTC